RKTAKNVMYTALKASLFIQNVKLEGHHKKNHFVFYTARHRIFKYIVFNYTACFTRSLNTRQV
ncbi:hypothetical protein, partial [Klebsiella michiganensis]|uniref:hypothetical protein n=1 Tax=Klebsiella michiganensis TaxID=1134687 RepID=UPI002FFC8946